jgi:hypothetical protein
VARSSQAPALFALFLVLAIAFAGVAWAAGHAGVWPIVAAAGILALWMASLAAQMLRRRH